MVEEYLHNGKRCRHFTSISEFYERCINEPLSNPSRWPGGGYYGGGKRHSRSTEGHHTEKWAGTNTFEEAAQLATSGWPEGVKKAYPLARRLSEELIETIARPKVVYEVTGEMFDMGKVMDDEPECWMQWVPGTDQTDLDYASKVGPVRIVMNIGTSAMVDKKIMMTRGAAVMALVLVFESAGRPTEIEIVDGIEDQNLREISVCVKNTYDDPQMDNLAFALVHPAFFRRMIFSMYEIMDIASQGGYGSPTNTIRPLGDIYLPQALGNDPQWSSEQAAEKWVKEQLVSQGVRFLK